MLSDLRYLFAFIRRYPLRVLAALLIIGAAGGIGAFFWREQARLAGGQAALARHDFATARECFESCLKWRSENAELHLLAAQAARRGGDIKAAEEHLFAAQKLAEVSEASTLEWALLRAQNGDPAGVERYLDEAQGRDADTSALVLEAAAQGALKKNNLPLALGFLDQLLTLRPDQYLGRYLRGRLWHERHRDDNARLDLARAVEMRPEAAEARLLYAENAYRLGHVGEAAAHFERVLRQRPGDVDALLGLARCRADGHDFDEAARLLGEVLAQKPRHVAALLEQGRLLLRQDRALEAEKSLTRALEAAPQDHAALVALQLALEAQNKGQAARLVLARRLQVEAAARRQRPRPSELTQDGH